MYNADGISAAVDFKLIPSIRQQSSDGALHCPGEAAGCPSTRYVLCAANAPNVTADQIVEFQLCWEQTLFKSIDDEAKKCATAANINFESISACFKGDQGDQLVNDAAKYFTTRFPDHAEGGKLYPKFGVPRVDINNVQQGTDEHPGQFAALLSALCATGIKAGACNTTSPTLV